MLINEENGTFIITPESSNEEFKARWYLTALSMIYSTNVKSKVVNGEVVIERPEELQSPLKFLPLPTSQSFEQG